MISLPLGWRLSVRLNRTPHMLEEHWVDTALEADVLMKKPIAIGILHDTVELAANPSWHDWTDHTHPNMNNLIDPIDPVSHQHTTINGETTS